MCLQRLAGLNLSIIAYTAIKERKGYCNKYTMACHACAAVRHHYIVLLPDLCRRLQLPGADVLCFLLLFKDSMADLV